MAKTNYRYDKRQRDLARQKKQEDKRLKKLARKTAEQSTDSDPPVAHDETP